MPDIFNEQCALRTRNKKPETINPQIKSLRKGGFFIIWGPKNYLWVLSIACVESTLCSVSRVAGGTVFRESEPVFGLMFRESPVWFVESGLVVVVALSLQETRAPASANMTKNFFIFTFEV